MCLLNSHAVLRFCGENELHIYPADTCHNTKPINYPDTAVSVYGILVKC